MVKVHLYEPTSLLGRIICWRTWGPYSHVAVEIDGKLYESMEGDGVRSSSVFDEGNLILCPTVTTEQEALMLEWWVERLGSKYDYWSIGAWLFRWKELKRSEDDYFCSEAVVESFEHAGIKLFLRKDAYKISPSDIPTSLIMEQECTEQ